MFVTSPELPVNQLSHAFYVPDTYLDTMEQLRAQLESDVAPPLANGYTFVCARPPACDETGAITSAAYTAFFSRRQIPYAPPGSTLFAHDLGHIPSFQSMFRVPRFADMVQMAATNAQSSMHGCDEFADSMDNFGDALRSLSLGMYEGMFDKASFALEGLVGLYNRSMDADNQALYNEVWERLGIDHYSASAA